MYYELVEEFTKRNIIKAEIVDEGYPYLYLTTSKDLYLLRASDMNIIYNSKDTDTFKIYREKEGTSNLKYSLVLKGSEKDKLFMSKQKKRKDRLVAGYHYAIKTIYGISYPDVIYLGSNLYRGYSRNASYSNIVLEGPNRNFSYLKQLYFYDTKEKDIVVIDYRRHLEEIVKLPNEKVDINLETLKDFCKDTQFVLLPGNYKPKNTL